MIVFPRLGTEPDFVGHPLARGPYRMLSSVPKHTASIGVRVVPGQLVRVSQTIVGRDRNWNTRVEGEVISLSPESTGSWYAHGKNDKLWLLRLRLKKADGEITTLALDHNSRIDVLG